MSKPRVGLSVFALWLCVTVVGCPRAPVTVQISVEQTSGEVPFTVDFSDISTTRSADTMITGWKWEFGDGLTSTQKNPIHKYEDPGAYTVKLTVTTSEGTATESFTNFVAALPMTGSAWSEVVEAAPWKIRLNHTSLDFAAAMWIIGGEVSDSAKGVIDDDVANDVWWSEDGETWTLATANAAWARRTNHSSVVFNDAMWVMGGETTDGLVMNDAWWSVDGETWTLATDDAGWSPRHGHTSVVFDGKMWVMGGETNLDVQNDVWYSEDGMTWTRATGNAGWLRRLNHSSVVFDGAMWVLGGETVNGVSNDVWFSTNGANWSRATNNAEWSDRLGQASVVQDNAMWVFGGEVDDGLDNEVWISFEGTTWWPYQNNAGWLPRTNHSALAFGSSIFVMGGETDDDLVNDVWVTPQMTK